MPLRLLPASISDGAAISHAYIGAFYDDVFNRAQFPGIPFDKMVAGAISRWEINFANQSSYYLKVVDEETGNIVAYSKWAFVGTDALIRLGLKEARRNGDPEPPEPGTPEGLNDPLATWFTERVRGIKMQTLGVRPHLEIKMLGTLPTYQHLGAASLSLEWATALADQEGLPIYTDSSEQSWQLYAKFGFEVVEEVVMDLTEWGLPKEEGGRVYVYRCMLREPKRASTRDDHRFDEDFELF